jgi:TolB-like protein/DNA-binding winged helix-turn-helix (wHTH) protein/Flp pilus assembly protein TadD
MSQLIRETLSSPKRLRFGPFEVDLCAGELRKRGLKIKLQEKPFQILAVLLERPNEVVTREELRQRLWPADTFVDFEGSLNTAANRLRLALGDSADNPRFVETIPRRGYRFIVPVEPLGSSSPAEGCSEENAVRALTEPDSAASEANMAAPLRPWRMRAAVLALLALVVVIVAASVVKVRFGAPSGSPGGTVMLAVLPFENLSGDPKQEHLADGMTEALIAELAQIRALRVVSRTSAMQYKGVHKPLPEIARELNVDAVVEGSVQAVGERVRIQARLLDSPSDTQLWAQSYERPLSDALALQHEVAGAIAREIKVRLTPEEQAHLASAGTLNAEAHEAYLRGRYFANQRTQEALKKSLECFQQATEKDPNYAPAYAALADSYLVLGGWGMLGPHEAYPKAKAATMRALAINDSLADAHTTLAAVRHEYDWDRAGAEREYKRAIEINPEWPNAHKAYAEYLMHMGRHEEAIAAIKRARELDPLSLITNAVAGLVLYHARKYDEAIEQCQKVLELDRDFAPAHYFLGRAYEQTGRFDEAIRHLREARNLSKDSSAGVAAVAHVYAVSGRSAEARKMLEQLKQLSKRNYVSHYSLAAVYAALGEREQALASLEKAREEHSSDLVYLKVDQSFDPLRSDPRFLHLLRSVGFTP